jgi:phosphatidylinositol glycan class A protein
VLAAVDQATLPSYYSALPLFRRILQRERADVVHGHSATSPLAHECLIAARACGVATVFTDHSLFGFADAASIIVNKYLKLTLSCVDAAICVSHTARENLVLRAALDPRRVWAIPNAVDASAFTPAPRARPASAQINIVMLSRLVHCKGIDLVVDVIPAICARCPEAQRIARYALTADPEALLWYPHKCVTGHATCACGTRRD